MAAPGTPWKHVTAVYNPKEIETETETETESDIEVESVDCKLEKRGWPYEGELWPEGMD